MRFHPVDGARMILDSDQRLDLSATVAFEHHIMIDGGGYPVRGTRRDCHHGSMLVHVCDVFDALRTHRPYRVAWEPNAIVDYIAQRAGTEFHPDITRAFVSMLRERDVRLARADAIDGVRVLT
jgi:putative two-component system response regulator